VIDLKKLSLSSTVRTSSLHGRSKLPRMIVSCQLTVASSPMNVKLTRARSIFCAWRRTSW
jgi:hypothetical protein